MRVYWTPEAIARLHDIESHIAEESPLAAKRVAARLVNRTRQLATVAHSGRRLPEYPDTPLRELLERPYRIIYRVIDEEVQIVTMMHYRQRLPKHPHQLTRGRL